MADGSSDGRAFLTPDDGGGVYLRRRVYFRAELASAITGLLEQLVYPDVWFQDGDLTPEQMAGFAQDFLNDYLDQRGYMIGTLVTYLSDDPPPGALALDGSTYDEADYPDLSAVLAAGFHNGDGTFTLPDARGRTIIGAGTGTGLSTYALGDLVGEETHTLDLSELTPHHHTYTKTVPAASDVLGELPGVQVAAYSDEDTSDTGGGNPHENRQPSLAANIGVWYL